MWRRSADISAMLVKPSGRSSDSQFVTISLKGGVLRASPVGPSINERASQVISSELNCAMKSAGRRLKALVLDMSQVTHMSSIGLGMCIDARNVASAVGAATFTVSLNRELTDLFRMMRVNRLITMALNEEELQKALPR